MYPRKNHSVIGIILLALVASLALSSAALARAPHRTPPVDGQSGSAKPGPRFDVVFVIDATGSMADEIDVVKTQIWDMAKQMMNGKPAPDIRFGLVFYRDISDSEILRTTPLTRDIQRVESELESVVASGGGDWEEHVGRGLHAALDLDWDTDRTTTRLVYLVGDAPPHMDYQDGFEVPRAISKATEMGVVVHAIGGSGLDQGTEAFRKIALATDGSFNYLTYHSVVADADGTRRSVIYEGGEYYEADGVLGDDEWRGGVTKLKEGKKVRHASSGSASKAAAAPRVNNLDSVVEDSVMDAAESMGVAY